MRDLEDVCECVFFFLCVTGMQECYEACLSLNLEEFSLAGNINDDETENEEGDKKLFLEYDRQLVILARIANFDKAAHRCLRGLNQISVLCFICVS
jgi:hypothetical protein